MDKLRMRFEKTGRAVYISHLDLMHTLQRAFSRAGYELKYSEGFNPHPSMSIALPLSVGAASVCELMDFTLKYDAVLSDMREKLNAAMPEGICVLEIYAAENKFAGLKWLEVKGLFEYDNRGVGEMAERLRAFYAAEHIVITKKTKRGVGETDIKPAIKSIKFKSTAEGVEVSAVVSAQEPTLNPELLTDALRQLDAQIAPDFAKFSRIETYCEDMGVFR